MHETQTWIRNDYGKSFKICNESNYEISVTEMQQKEKEHSENLEK